MSAAVLDQDVLLDVRDLQDILIQDRCRHGYWPP